MRAYHLIPFFVIASSGAFAKAAPKDTPGIKAVSHCVEVVHNTNPQDVMMKEFYTHFDAFYNPATDNIENNARRVGDQDALFVFNKCMTEQGFPMVYKKN